MSEKCFLKNCSATIEDREKMQCSCLICLGENFGKNQENCVKLCNTTEWLKQQFICGNCKNYRAN